MKFRPALLTLTVTFTTAILRDMTTTAYRRRSRQPESSQTTTAIAYDTCSVIQDSPVNCPSGTSENYYSHLDTTAAGTLCRRLTDGCVVNAARSAGSGLIRGRQHSRLICEQEKQKRHRAFWESRVTCDLRSRFRLPPLGYAPYRFQSPPAQKLPSGKTTPYSAAAFVRRIEAEN